MLRYIGCCGLLMLGCLVGVQLNAGAPIPPTEVAPFELIAAELEQRVQKLQDLLADAEKFEAQQEQIVRSAGVIACLSQAAIEHKQFSQAKFAAAALRDTAIELQQIEEHADGLPLLEQLKAAWTGKASGEHKAEHAWTGMISMYDLMEEMNDRNGGLSRSLRRSRGKLEEQLNASTNAILAIPMLADHADYTDEDNAAEWKQLSIDYQQAMTNLITAIREQKQDKIAAYYQAGNRACDKCHESFRD